MVFISIGFAICAFIPVAVYCCCVISIISAMPRVIKTLPNRQRISFHATGCHFTGPVALRPRLSSGLPIILLFIVFKLMQNIDVIILPQSIVHKKNLTALTLKNKKEQPMHILELFSYFQSPRSIDITVSCVMILSVTTGKFPAAAIICIY